MSGSVIDSVGHLLFVTCGVSVEMAQKTKIDVALDYIRNKLDCGQDATLVICIDEVVELDSSKSVEKDEKEPRQSLCQRVMSECMKFQDKSEGKVIFLFTAILDSMFIEQTTTSGRAVLPLPLNMIPLSCVFDSTILSKPLRALASRFPGVHQLILSCAGHPRATADGLRFATKGWNETETIAVS